MRKIHGTENKIILAVCVLVIIISVVLIIGASFSKSESTYIGKNFETTQDSNTPEEPNSSSKDPNSSYDEDIATYFKEEIEDCIEKLNSICTEKSFVFAVVTDTHYTGSNNWLNTKKNIEAINQQFKFDAIYHLGDLINGNLEKQVSADLICEIRNDLYKINSNSYLIPGNHDDNSFYDSDKHTDMFTKGEWYSMMGRYNDINVVRSSNNMYWYQDIQAFGIRIIALDSRSVYDSNIRNGYSEAEVDWVKNVALDTDNQVLFLSHMPLTKEFNYNNSSLLNGDKLRNIIEDFKANGGSVIGYLHGHTHWDYIGKKNETGFYEISTGAAKTTESTSEYRPSGAIVRDRKHGTLSEDLWDIYIILPETRTVKIVRFGAGEDREFTY